MALKSTIYKATIHLSDMDRNYYDTLNLTLAQHPSETDLRLMSRLMAFVLNAHEQLTFGKGLSDEDEAALWQMNLQDDIELWIELGQPEEKRLKKACHKADKVILYGYQSSFDIWWQQNHNKLRQYDNLCVEKFDEEAIEQLAELLTRTMELQVSIQDGQLWLTCGDDSLLIERECLQQVK
ncbi:YaeQ family protein [Thalassotalea sp. G2M2-11]|uniref:YaeQ family protein n=1 Tax=Thalassotalea sp. G2M2-11 TaxID=2787627 RepID=UPI0019D27866|nr:YaeQ family protein [Thalassotalea sp. G2M2-11]